MHIALMEPNDRAAADRVAELCAATATSLHLIGPVGFATGELEGREAEGQLDLWIHPDWFEFRRAIARERCYYFSADGTKTIDEARVRSTSVLMFAGPEGMPDRIKEKYPHRMYKLPAEGIAGVRAVLTAALAKTGGATELPVGAPAGRAPESEGMKKGRPRRRSGKKPG
jgi:tRNA (cytidine/uridine-2'-O-)-methyltransferase